MDPTETVTLSATATETLPGGCATDAFEPNDSYGVATQIVPQCGPSGTGLPQRRYRLRTGSTLSPVRPSPWTLGGIGGDLPADFDLWLFDADGIEVDRSTHGGGAPERIRDTALMSGEYRVYVNGYGGAYHASASYVLTVNVSNPGGGTPTATATPTPTASTEGTTTATATPTATVTPTATTTVVPAQLWLPWTAFASGGGRSAAGTTRLAALAGQASAAGETTSASYRLRGGYYGSEGILSLPSSSGQTTVLPSQPSDLLLPDGSLELSFPAGAVDSLAEGHLLAPTGAGR